MIATGCYQRAWRVTTEPASEPITVAEAKSHCRIEVSDDDTLIGTYIAAARQWVERVGIGRSLITQTLTLTLDGFPEYDEPILLPQPPGIAVSSISYVDSAGATQTWGSSNYRVDVTRDPARVTPVFGGAWPVTRAITSDVTVVYTAGYGSASAVPSAIKTAILFLVANWYENREPVAVGTIAPKIPWTVESLLEPYSIKGFS